MRLMCEGSVVCHSEREREADRQTGGPGREAEKQRSREAEKEAHAHTRADTHTHTHMCTPTDRYMRIQALMQARMHSSVHSVHSVHSARARARTRAPGSHDLPQLHPPPGPGAEQASPEAQVPRGHHGVGPQGSPSLLSLYLGRGSEGQEKRERTQRLPPPLPPSLPHTLPPSPPPSPSLSPSPSPPPSPPPSPIPRSVHIRAPSTSHGSAQELRLYMAKPILATQRFDEAGRLGRYICVFPLCPPPPPPPPGLFFFLGFFFLGVY